MPKQLFVDPKAVRRAGKVTFPDLPVHVYSTPLSREQQRFGVEQLEEVLRHMLIIREFEKMLDSFKAQGNFAGFKFNYNDPAHLSIGQEACERGSFLMTLATNISRFAFGHLKAPPRVFGAPSWIVPGAAMETSYFPQSADIVAAVRSELVLEQETDWLSRVGRDEAELARLAL